MSDDRGHGRRDLAQILRDDLRRAEVESPSFERLVDYVEGRLSHEERAELEERLAEDAVLRAEVDGLRELHGQMRGHAPTASPAPRRPWILAGLAAAAAVAAIALWLRPPEPERARAGSSPAPAPAADLRDGDLRLVLAADGSVSGLPTIDPAQGAAVARALRGALPRPDDLDALRGGPRTLMGAPASPGAFAPHAPVGTRVGTGRPVFRWRAHPDARTYEVAVYDPDFHRQAASGPVNGTEWQPPQALAEGRVYLWQVSAVTGRGRVTVPAPPAPEARFEVAAPSVRARIDARRSPAPDSHLLAVLAFVEAGLLDDAEREVEALSVENPGSPAVARLREGLSALR